ncbi:glycoside hydrolase superfamily [Earliella scabrosa]|nr:glycoside hydrolase superfamily [Earliella scabrosa]
MRLLLAAGVLATAFLCRSAVAYPYPEKIYGVNLGSWLLLEPWMLPQEWADMGGENNCPCATCIGSEFALAQAYPDTVDQRFDKHWSTWFNQKDVDALVEAGINTVRIPLGYWLVERLVDRRTEFYPRGGILHLQRGVKALKNAGIAVILDHHALPGAQAVNQQFAGRCTNDPQFYTTYNYQRALVWTAVMTAVSHLDPDFESVFAIEAVNEPIMDALQTPGYGDFQKNFVQTMRAIEFLLGINVQGLDVDIKFSPSASNVTAAMSDAVAGSAKLNKEVADALLASIPILVELSRKLNFRLDFHGVPRRQRQPLITNFMDVNWQHNNPPNPANAAIGPAAYDNHLYYSFGGVADANELAYMISICNLDRVERDAAVGDAPLWFGEWALPTQFSASDEFLFKWADAQKLAYSKGRGWIFWNFKTEVSALAGDTPRQWSYFEGLRRGYLTKDPSKLHDPDVCAPYIGKTYTGTSSAAASASSNSSFPSSSPASVPPSSSVTASASTSTSSSASVSASVPASSSAAPASTVAFSPFPDPVPSSGTVTSRSTDKAPTFSQSSQFTTAAASGF